MDPKIKQQWVHALRSGKYVQGRGRLRDGDAMCCLGVLCDIVAPDNWRYVEETSCREPEGWHQDNFQMGVPESLFKTVGINLSEPIIEYRGENKAISLVNDEGVSFSEIADLIEAQW